MISSYTIENKELTLWSSVNTILIKVVDVQKTRLFKYDSSQSVIYQKRLKVNRLSLKPKLELVKLQLFNSYLNKLEKVNELQALILAPT